MKPKELLHTMIKNFLKITSPLILFLCFYNFVYATNTVLYPQTVDEDFTLNGNIWNIGIDYPPQGEGGSDSGIGSNVYVNCGVSGAPVDISLQEMWNVIQNCFSVSTTTTAWMGMSTAYVENTESISWHVTNGIIDEINGTSTIPNFYDTRIVSISPENKAQIATTSSALGIGATTTLAVEYYINEEDLGWIIGVEVLIKNTDQNYIFGASDYSEYTIYETILPEAGEGTWSHTLWLPEGNYEISAKILTSIGIVPINPIQIAQSLLASQDESNPIAQYHQYRVGLGTYIGNTRQNWNQELENILSATGTAPTLADCNVLSGFNFKGCMVATFVPSSDQLKGFVGTITNDIFPKFPFGYIWSVVSILNSTSTTALPIISGTVPPGIGGTGAHIELALTPGILDYVLYATTSSFTNESAPSSASLYSITSYYWNILVYMGVFMYLLSRILGSHLIGNIGNMLGSSFGTVGSASSRKKKSNPYQNPKGKPIMGQEMYRKNGNFKEK